MGLNSNIDWTDHTWNPWIGCHRVSMGCEQCYMFRERIRYGKNPEVVVRAKPPTFNLPLKIERSAKIFTCSWSDWFIKEADDWRDEAWEIIRRTPHLTYQILTKRIERAVGRLPWGDGTPWKNVWLMVSAENQETFDRRVPILMSLNAAMRGVSLEPLLGPIDLDQHLRCQSCGYSNLDRLIHGDHHYCQQRHFERRLNVLDWVIVGGESIGPRDRVCQVKWIDDIVEQCQLAGTACFVKQDAGSAPGMQGRISDSIWAVKEFPQARAIKPEINSETSANQ